MAASRVKVAVVQHNPQVGIANKRKNVVRTLQYLRQASQAGADLVVFPELANTGYAFHSMEEAYEHAEDVADGWTISLWKEAAKTYRCHICAGFAEKDRDKLYNSTALIGPDGLIGTYRKTHLWDKEKLIFAPGNAGLPVYDTEIGRIGMAICWDAWFPETYRILGIQGADIVCASNNFSHTPDTTYDHNGISMAVYLMMSHAHMNGFYVAAANRVGTERGERFIGGSVITGPQGWPIAIATPDDEALLLAELDLAESRKTAWSPYSDLYGDRRVDLYDSVLGMKDGYVWRRQAACRSEPL